MGKTSLSYTLVFSQAEFQAFRLFTESFIEIFDQLSAFYSHQLKWSCDEEWRLCRQVWYWLYIDRNLFALRSSSLFCNASKLSMGLSKDMAHSLQVALLMARHIIPVLLKALPSPRLENKALLSLREAANIIRQPIDNVLLRNV